MFHSFDQRAAVRADLASLVVESVRLARILRAPFVRPMGDEQRARRRVAARITELLVLCAFARGKLHVVHRPRALPQDGPFDPHAHAAAVAARALVPYAAFVSAKVTSAGEAR